jgi:pimeloyl-ACP methyl ester carboxylesterase
MSSFSIPSDQFIEIDNLRFHYLDWGGAGFPLIFIPGFGWTPHIFSSLATHFIDEFHVYGFTRRWHGKSDKPPNGYDIPTLASDIGGFLNKLDIKSAHFVGHSMGGYEISQLACDLPERAASLTFLDSAWNEADWRIDVPDPVDSYFSFEEPENFESYDGFKEFLRQSRPDINKIWCEILDFAVREMLLFSDDGSARTNLSKETRKILLQEINNFRHSYDNIRCPTLAIYALYEVSQALPEDASDEIRVLSKEYIEQFELPWIREQIRLFKDGVSNSKVVEFWNVTHHFYLEREEDVAHEIMNFLQEST